MAKALTKPGQYGPLHLFVFEYGDVDGRERIHLGHWRTWAYNLEHAIEKFYDSDEHFVAFRVARATDAPTHRWSWHNLDIPRDL